MKRSQLHVGERYYVRPGYYADLPDGLEVLLLTTQPWRATGGFRPPPGVLVADAVQYDAAITLFRETGEVTEPDQFGAAVASLRRAPQRG